jgi:hypothetical protein
MPQTEVHLFKDSKGKVPCQIWLDELKNTEPKAYAKCLERVLQLSTLGFELRRPHADVLRDGIRELRIRNKNVQYRLLYFFSGKNVALLSHGITKESNVPDEEIDRAIKNKELVEKDFEKHTAEFEV